MQKHEHTIPVTQEPQDTYPVPVKHRRITAGGVAGTLLLTTVAGIGGVELARQGNHEHKQEVKMIEQALKSNGEFWSGNFETNPGARVYDSPSFQKETVDGLVDNMSDQQLPKDTKLSFPRGAVFVTDYDGNRFALAIIPTKDQTGPINYPTNVEDLAEHAKLIPIADMFPDKDARNTVPEPIGDQIEGVLGSLPATEFEIIQPTR